MGRAHSLKHEFVEFIPEQLDAGILYISLEYAVGAHLCFCGCRSKVVTPLHPTHWKLEFDGSTVSLWPSIGSWSLPCRSHYWIRHGQVEWAPTWSNKEIMFGTRNDQQVLEHYYETRNLNQHLSDGAQANQNRPKFWGRILNGFFKPQK